MDTVTAIIFLAPVCAFNQCLAEDSSVNRLADSMKLWKQICCNKILADVKLVLFLNKIDILALMLKKGVRFNKYVVSYKDDDGSKNNIQDIIHYLTECFKQIHREFTPKQRRVHVHWTCATVSSLLLGMPCLTPGLGCGGYVTSYYQE
jgi:guanine nucleotide-binding protein alpha-1 subunit